MHTVHDMSHIRMFYTVEAFMLMDFPSSPTRQSLVSSRQLSLSRKPYDASRKKAHEYA